MITGGCYCGKIRFEVAGDIRPVVSCHCSQCRKFSGHYVAASQAHNDELTVTGAPKWFASSEGHERAFCPDCGTPLFWRALDEDHSSIMAGAFDAGTKLISGKHIFTEDKADYYQIYEDKVCE